MMNLEEIERDANNSSSDLSSVARLANQALDLRSKIENLEYELNQAKATLFKLETEEIPDEMDALGLKKFSLSTGEEISVSPVISSSLPSKTQISKADDDERPILEHRLKSGLDFLRENGADSLIKNVLEFELDKGKDNVVPRLIEIADELGIPHNRDEKVNHMTLNKFIKERIRDGKPVPMDIFSVYNGRKASIVKPKTKKGENK